MRKIQIAILDDYQNAALSMADWSLLYDSAEITVFNDHIFEEDILVKRLKSFDILCVMRERTTLNQHLLVQLPKLKLIVSTGSRNAAIDVKAAEVLGIEVSFTGYMSSGAIELTWALLMSAARHIPAESTGLKNGNWQTTVGSDLHGKTIGIVGLGNIGQKIAVIAKAFDMNIIAWSANLTTEKAALYGAVYVSKETLFKEADFITVHLVLGKTTRGIIDKKDFALMKPDAYFINTSRGTLVNEADLIDVLSTNRIAGAALDVFDTEPLAADHPFRKLNNVLATPHLGFVTKDTYSLFFKDTVTNIQQWITSRANSSFDQ